jgi:hypothetical protein
MKKAFVVLMACSTVGLVAAPANAQACGDEGRYFHLRPPSYSIPPHRRQSIHRWAKALRWYREHNGDKPLCVNGKPVQ